MPSSYTTNKGLEKPEYNTYVNSWNVPLNTDMDLIDQAFGYTYPLNVTGGSLTLGVNVYRSMAISVSGGISSNVICTIPEGIGGTWIIYNSTTDSVPGGPYTVTFKTSAVSGTSVVVRRGFNTTIYSDGTNIRLADNAGSPGGSNQAIQYNASGNFAGSTNFVFDYTNVKVGLGTASPASTLDIVAQASTAASIGLLTPDNTKTSAIFFAQTSGGAWSAGVTAYTGSPLAGGDFAIGTTGGQTAYKIQRDGSAIFSHSFYIDTVAAMTVADSEWVGIGTTEPGARLEVKSTEGTSTQGIAKFYNANTGNRYAAIDIHGYTQTNHNKMAQIVAYVVDQGTIIPNSATAADLIFRVNNGTTDDCDNRFRITSTGLVGMGTLVDAPTYQVSVGAANPTRGILAQFKNTSTSSLTGSQILLTQNTTNWVFGQSDPAVGTTNSFAWWAGRTSAADGTEVMRLTSTGLLGLGTTTPAYNVDIVNTTSANIGLESNGSTSVVMKRHSNDVTGPNNSFYKSRGTTASPLIVNSGDEIGSLEFYTYDGTAYRNNARIVATVNGTPGSSDTPSKVSVYTTPDASAVAVEKLYVDNAGVLGFDSGYGSAAAAYGCRAFVNFNGIGTVAIRKGGNIKSVVDIAVGTYTITFDTPLVDANYTVVATNGNWAAALGGGFVNISGGTGPDSTKFTVYSRNGAGTATDLAAVCVAVFR